MSEMHRYLSVRLSVLLFKKLHKKTDSSKLQSHKFGTYLFSILPTISVSLNLVYYIRVKHLNFSFPYIRIVHIHYLYKSNNVLLLRLTRK